MDIAKLEKKIRAGHGTFQDLHRVCVESGRRLSKDVSKQLEEEFPNGDASEEDVRRIIHPVLQANHKRISELSAQVINAMYKRHGVGIRSVIPKYNVLVEDDIIRELTEGSEPDDA